MSRCVLVDTGPLVAILCREDAHHERCVASLRDLRDELVTCWPVVTEAVHLLGGRVDRVRRLLAMLSSGAVHCADLPSDAPDRLAVFYTTYEEHGPDLADAALMLLAEQTDAETVFSLDQRDFAIYRTKDGRALHVLPDAIL